MKPFRLLVFILPLVLTACGLSDQQKADYSSVQRSGVSPAIYDKMMHDDALSIYDIKALSRAHVSDAVVLRYMRDHGTAYYLSSGDIDGLHKAGVSQSVIDYMLQTGQNNGPVFYPTIGIGYGPYWGPYYGPGPYYYGRGGYYHHWR
jgi:hypothetical protein